MSHGLDYTSEMSGAEDVQNPVPSLPADMRRETITTSKTSSSSSSTFFHHSSTSESSHTTRIITSDGLEDVSQSSSSASASSQLHAATGQPTTQVHEGRLHQMSQRGAAPPVVVDRSNLLQMEGDKVVHMVSDSSSSSLNSMVQSTQESSLPLIGEQQILVARDEAAPIIMQPKPQPQQIPVMMEQPPPVVVQQPAYALVEPPAATVVQQPIQATIERPSSMVMEQPEPMVIQHVSQDGAQQTTQQTTQQITQQQTIKKSEQSVQQRIEMFTNESYIQKDSEQDVHRPREEAIVPTEKTAQAPTSYGLAKQIEPSVPSQTATLNTSNAVNMPKKKSEIKRKSTPARFISPLQGLLVKENDRVNFECSIDGYPEPAISWTHNGEPLGPDVQVSVDINRVSLVIPRASQSHSGRYTCAISNEAGSAQCTCDLVVKKTQFPPVFSKRLQPMVVGESERLHLEIDVTGTPHPDIVWTKDNQQLIPKDGTEISEDGTRHYLIIHRAAVSDSGRYGVIASNPAGRAECLADVMVTQLIMDNVPQPQTMVFSDVCDDARKESQEQEFKQVKSVKRTIEDVNVTSTTQLASTKIPRSKPKSPLSLHLTEPVASPLSPTRDRPSSLIIPDSDEEGKKTPGKLRRSWPPVSSDDEELFRLDSGIEITKNKVSSIISSFSACQDSKLFTTNTEKKAFKSPTQKSPYSPDQPPSPAFKLQSPMSPAAQPIFEEPERINIEESCPVPASPDAPYVDMTLNQPEYVGMLGNQMISEHETVHCTSPITEEDQEVKQVTSVIVPEGTPVIHVNPKLLMEPPIYKGLSPIPEEKISTPESQITGSISPTSSKFMASMSEVASDYDSRSLNQSYEESISGMQESIKTEQFDENIYEHVSDHNTLIETDKMLSTTDTDSSLSQIVQENQIPINSDSNNNSNNNDVVTSGISATENVTELHNESPQSMEFEEKDNSEIIQDENHAMQVDEPYAALPEHSVLLHEIQSHANLENSLIEKSYSSDMPEYNSDFSGYIETSPDMVSHGSELIPSEGYISSENNDFVQETNLQSPQVVLSPVMENPAVITNQENVKMETNFAEMQNFSAITKNNQATLDNAQYESYQQFENCATALEQETSYSTTSSVKSRVFEINTSSEAHEETTKKISSPAFSYTQGIKVATPLVLAQKNEDTSPTKPKSTPTTPVILHSPGIKVPTPFLTAEIGSGQQIIAEQKKLHVNVASKVQEEISRPPRPPEDAGKERYPKKKQSVKELAMKLVDTIVPKSPVEVPGGICMFPMGPAQSPTKEAAAPELKPKKKAPAEFRLSPPKIVKADIPNEIKVEECKPYIFADDPKPFEFKSPFEDPINVKIDEPVFVAPSQSNINHSTIPVSAPVPKQHDVKVKEDIPLKPDFAKATSPLLSFFETPPVFEGMRPTVLSEFDIEAAKPVKKSVTPNVNKNKPKLVEKFLASTGKEEGDILLAQNQNQHKDPPKIKQKNTISPPKFTSVIDEKKTKSFSSHTVSNSQQETQSISKSFQSNQSSNEIFTQPSPVVNVNNIKTELFLANEEKATVNEAINSSVIAESTLQATSQITQNSQMLTDEQMTASQFMNNEDLSAVKFENKGYSEHPVQNEEYEYISPVENKNSLQYEKAPEYMFDAQVTEPCYKTNTNISSTENMQNQSAYVQRSDNSSMSQSESQYQSNINQSTTQQEQQNIKSSEFNSMNIEENTMQYPDMSSQVVYGSSIQYTQKLQSFPQVYSPPPVQSASYNSKQFQYIDEAEQSISSTEIKSSEVQESSFNTTEQSINSSNAMQNVSFTSENVALQPDLDVKSTVNTTDQSNLNDEILTTSAMNYQDPVSSFEPKHYEASSTVQMNTFNTEQESMFSSQSYSNNIEQTSTADFVQTSVPIINEHAAPVKLEPKQVSKAKSPTNEAVQYTPVNIAPERVESSYIDSPSLMNISAPQKATGPRNEQPLPKTVLTQSPINKNISQVTKPIESYKIDHMSNISTLKSVSGISNENVPVKPISEIVKPIDVNQFKPSVDVTKPTVTNSLPDLDKFMSGKNDKKTAKPKPAISKVDSKVEEKMISKTSSAKISKLAENLKNKEEVVLSSPIVSNKAKPIASTGFPPANKEESSNNQESKMKRHSKVTDDSSWIKVRSESVEKTSVSSEFMNIESSYGQTVSQQYNISAPAPMPDNRPQIMSPAFSEFSVDSRTTSVKSPTGLPAPDPIIFSPIQSPSPALGNMAPSFRCTLSPGKNAHPSRTRMGGRAQSQPPTNIGKYKPMPTNLQPFPFEITPPKPKKPNVPPPTNPKKFQPSQFSESNYQSDLDGAKISSSVWQACKQDSEAMYREMHMKLQRGRSQQPRIPSPPAPSKFDEGPLPWSEDVQAEMNNITGRSSPIQPLNVKSPAAMNIIKAVYTAAAHKAPDKISGPILKPNKEQNPSEPKGASGPNYQPTGTRWPCPSNKVAQSSENTNKTFVRSRTVSPSRSTIDAYIKGTSTKIKIPEKPLTAAQLDKTSKGPVGSKVRPQSYHEPPMKPTAPQIVPLNINSQSFTSSTNQRPKSEIIQYGRTEEASYSASSSQFSLQQFSSLNTQSNSNQTSSYGQNTNFMGAGLTNNQNVKNFGPISFIQPNPNSQSQSQFSSSYKSSESKFSQVKNIWS